MDKKRFSILPHFFEGNEFYLLKFNYNPTLVNLAKGIGCRWTVDKGGWVMAKSDENLERILVAFQELVVFDGSRIGLDLQKTLKEIPLGIRSKDPASSLGKPTNSDANSVVQRALLRTFFHSYDLEDAKQVSADMLRHYLEELKHKRHWPKAVIQLHKKALAHYFPNTLNWKQWEQDQSEQERVAQKKRLTGPELYFAIESQDHPEFSFLLELMLETGWDLSELLALKKRDFESSTLNRSDRLDEKYRVYLEETQPEEWLFELSKGRQVQTNEMWVRLKVFLRSKLQLYFFDQAQTEAETPEEMPSSWAHQEKLEDYISLHFNGLATDQLPKASQSKAQGS